MADNEENQQPNEQAAAGEQAAGPQFALQRIYLKDASFESPRSPLVFQSQWQPKINFDIKTRCKSINYRCADSMESASGRIRATSKFSTSMKFCHHDFNARESSLWFFIYWNTATIIMDLN